MRRPQVDVGIDHLVTWDFAPPRANLLPVGRKRQMSRSKTDSEVRVSAFLRHCLLIVAALGAMLAFAASAQTGSESQTPSPAAPGADTQPQSQDASTTEETTGSISPPTSSIPQDGNGVEQGDTERMILVSKRPIEILARPSSSAVVMYGFPAGRRFRLIGHQAGFAQIQDLKSGAIGWIDEITLWPSHESMTSAPSNPKSTLSPQEAKTPSLPPKPKPVSHNHKTATASHKSKPKATSKETKTSRPEHPKRHGIFGPPRNPAQGVLF